MPAAIESIEFLSPLSECNPENDNIDVHLVLADGREFTVVFATPNNISWCMENEGTDYLFGQPFVFVKRLTRENVERALVALVAEDDGKLGVYG